MNKSSEDQTQTNQVWGTNVSNLSWWRRRQRYLLSCSCGGVGGKNWVENVGIKILGKKVFLEIFCCLSNTLYLNKIFLS